jgi:phosphate:Na+ symporter
MFHTLYNISTMLLLLPFITYIARLMEKLVPMVAKKAGNVYEKKLVYLDGPMPSIPATAVFNAHMEISRMGQAACENFALATAVLVGRDKAVAKMVPENEEVIDFLNHKITSKLTVINRMRLSPLDAVKVGKLFLVLSDIERIGDHAVSISAHVGKMMAGDRNFSPDAQAELAELGALVERFVFDAARSFTQVDKTSAEDFRAAAKKANKQARRAVKNHTRRLKEEICTPANGVIFTAIVNDLQRTIAHAKNIAFSANIEDKWNKA